MPSPAKMMLPDFKALEKRLEAALWEQFDLPSLSEEDVKVIKAFDLRMLATEKRDLMTGSIPGDKWEMLADFEPFDSLAIVPFFHPHQAAEHFLRLWKWLND